MLLICTARADAVEETWEYPAWANSIDYAVGLRANPALDDPAHLSPWQQ